MTMTPNSVTPPNHEDNRPIMFYDGGCPMCAREVNHYRKLDRRARVRWYDIHAEPQLPERYGIAAQAAQAELHVRDSAGQIQTGVPGFIVIWRELPYWHWLAPIASLPGIFHLLQALYRPFARWRLKRRCAEGVCTIGPV